MDSETCDPCLTPRKAWAKETLGWVQVIEICLVTLIMQSLLPASQLATTCSHHTSVLWDAVQCHYQFLVSHLFHINTFSPLYQASWIR